MGIKGLLPVLKSIHKHVSLKKFSGQTIGIDGYGWLHRGVVACSFALVMDKPTTLHIDYVLKQLRMMMDFGVTPYMVFDGDNLPSKAGTNAIRRKKREGSRALGLELHRAGKTKQAQQELQKAIDVTPLMARQLIEELKKLNVQYIVAPYEADAQLVYLERKGIINGILAEDSDMLVFGAQRLLTKLNQYGEVVEIERRDFAMVKEISLAGWTDTMFRRMAILSGCDYLSNIGNLGMKTAYGLVRKYNEIDKILRIVQLEGKLIVPVGYQEQFRNAELTFLHHRVFCPIAQQMVHLNPLEPGMPDMPFLGPYVDASTAAAVACGDLDPFSKEPFQLDDKSLARPVLGERRRQSYASAPELKPKASIDSFFKRQPLAELDPNSLTPSPSQQRLLDRNRNVSWEPRLVSSAPSLRKSTTVQAPSSSDRANFLASAATLSTYQPMKRQRLCAESTESPGQEVKQSPFFSSTLEQGSPLALKAPKSSRRGQKSRIEVFADENEMLLKPEVLASPEGPFQKSQPTRLVEADSQESIPQSSPVAKPPSPPHEGDRVRIAHITEGVHRDEDPDAFEDLLEQHVRMQNEALKKSREKGSLIATFAWQSEGVRDTALQSLSPRSKKSMKEQSIPAIKSLPQSADIQSFCAEVKMRRTWDASSAAIQQTALESLTTRSKTAKQNAPTVPAVEQAPLSPAVRRTKIQGSEDALAPNSEDDSSEVGSPARKPRFNLSAFLFGGAS